jgi:hypothetical protein
MPDAPPRDARPSGREITVNIARAARRRKLRLIIPGMAVAIAGLLVSFSPIASAHAITRTVPAGGPKPTIVLEHGAWADSGSWDAVTALLWALVSTVDMT